MANPGGPARWNLVLRLLLRGLVAGAVAAPWAAALLGGADPAPLWVFGAIVGLVWLAIVEADPELGAYTALLSLAGVGLGLLVGWFLLLILIPLFLVECGVLLDEARHGRRRAVQTLDEPAEDGREGPARFGTAPFCQAVAQAVCDQGYLGVTEADVAAVCEKIRRRETPAAGMEEVIASAVWRRMAGLGEQFYR